jgi:hypothetical protein
MMIRKIQTRKKETIQLCVLGCQLYREILESYTQSIGERSSLEVVNLLKLAKVQLDQIQEKEIGG